MNNINKVAIFGLARSGKSALKLARSKGINTIVVNQGEVNSWFEQTEGLVDRTNCFSEDEASEVFTQVDFIILSPGIPREHKSLARALAQGIPVISEIEFAYRFFSHIPVIAITGTNGKTTTTTMITQALEKLGKKVFCGGNIGIPYSDLAQVSGHVDYAVIEVSSFQLESIETFHPQVAMILNVFPNHTERYHDVESYAASKNNIFKNMTSENFLILGKENPYLHLIETAAIKTYFSLESQVAFDFSRARLKGKHNKANFLATKLTLDFLKLGDDESFQHFVETFTGVEHRLEFVTEYQGLRIYNDAKSTNALATVTAIKSFEDPIYLIIGGKLRSETDKLLPDLISFKDKIKKIFLIGEVTDRLSAELESEFTIEKCYEVKTVLEYARAHGLKGDLVFSPAHPSFDQFKSFVDRGECFKQWVNEIF